MQLCKIRDHLTYSFSTVATQTGHKFLGHPVQYCDDGLPNVGRSFSSCKQHSKLILVGVDCMAMLYLTDLDFALPFIRRLFFISDFGWISPNAFSSIAVQVIVRYNELNLIMHPVILNLIQLKWNLFGKKHALHFLGINFIYTLIWTAIGITIPKKETVSYYSPVSKYWWRVALEVIGCIMTLAFLVQVCLSFATVSDAINHNQMK